MTNILESSTTLDDFSIERVIGKGSFGSVFLVRRKLDQKLYALKSVFLEKLNKKEQENSVNEVRLLASVSHPNVISYKEAFFDEKNNSLNIIMEYADNGDLQTEINKKKNNSEIFNEDIIWLYSIQMIEGLKALHDKKIMHRDLKSANIFLSKNKLQCKLGDMNVSKIIKEKVLRTQTGTPYYASPEVWRDEPYSYKSDLWSIGIVIYEMCALEPPFNGKDLDELYENVIQGKINRINKCYSDDLWNMILMLLQNDVEKRVNCDEFLESDLIRRKIEELKNNDDINYEGYLLEENINLKSEDNVLLDTIKFRNFNELKNNLPSLKNYENNYNKRTSSKNDSISIYKSKNNSVNTLVINSSMKNYTNIINKSLNNNKVRISSKKRLNNKNSSFTKENQNPNHISKTSNNLEENSSIKIITKKKGNTIKMKKNSSFKGESNSSYLVIPTNEKSVKKIYKDFEKIIELNKIKEFLKIKRKKEKSIIKTERSKKDLNLNLNKKNINNIVRNQTENNKRKIIKKIKENNDSIRLKKNKSKIKITNQNQYQNLVKRVNTEQKISIINKIYKLNFSTLIQKKLIKSPTSISIKINSDKNRSHSFNGIRKKNTIQVKNKLKNLYHNIFNNINTNDRKNKKLKLKNKIPNYIPFLLKKEKHKINNEKSYKRNLTTIPCNQEINNFIIPLKLGKKNRLLNEEFNTVNFHKDKRNNNLKSNYYCYLNCGNLTSNDKRQKSLKENKKIIYKNKIINRKEKRAFSIKNKKLLNEGFNDNSITTTNNINTSNNIQNHSIFVSNNNLKKIKNLFNFKNYSIMVNKGYKHNVLEDKEEIKNKSKYENNNNENFISKLNLSKKINKQKNINPTINESYITLSLRQKTLNSSNGNSINKSNLDVIKKRNHISYKLNIIKKKNKPKNISLKKLNIPHFYRIDKNNNFLKYKKHFNSQKNMLEYENNNYIKSNRERNHIDQKINKNKINISESNNYLIPNHNNFLQNMKPVYLDIKNGDNMNIICKKRLNKIIKNKRINTSNSGCNLKREKMVNSQIFNNFYSINNFDTNHPVKVINFYN